MEGGEGFNKKKYTIFRINGYRDSGVIIFHTFRNAIFYFLGSLSILPSMYILTFPKNFYVLCAKSQNYISDLYFHPIQSLYKKLNYNTVPHCTSVII